MTKFLSIHPDNPQKRLLQEVVLVLKQGGVIVYPTDSTYALGCSIGNKEAISRIKLIRQLDEKHYLTLICQSLSELGTYARVTDTAVFRQLKAHVPGPYTFLLKATHEVPKRLLHPKRKSIGLRIPDNEIVQQLLIELGEPLLSTSLILSNEKEPLAEPQLIYQRLKGRVDLIIDGGIGSRSLTSVIDFYNDTPVIIRKGKGDVSAFE
ncbi:MAG: threonylcarbamoyl-AMP synthase [Gammaproteobacteria bacterium RIFCSPHIGHO2_12_FULL_35_23]|nr:MAG: threonylcarbamoyl-AMP synthase [Gammaproteobacteria bacterium RIFCSPHIGHO2_12_FULL_35_23]